MTQPASAPPPTAPARRPGSPGAVAPANRGVATRAPATPPVPSPAGAGAVAPRTGALSRTPGRLRLAAAIAALACLAIAVAGLVGGLVQSSALGDAVADTDQQVRALGVRNDLVAADATATNAFLVGGLEPVEQRAQYDESLTAAGEGLTAVAGANGDDAASLGSVNAGVSTYAGLVEQARANNRQGFPVGAAYLETASQELRDVVLPGLDGVAQANDDRVESAFDAASLAQLALIVLVVGAVVLVVVQVWLARRVHRRLNVGLLVATVLVVVAGFTLFSSLQAGAQTARDVEAGSYGRTVAVARAFSLANDARAMESFTLIKRGSGQAYEEAYQAAVAEAGADLAAAEGTGAPVTQAFDAWTATHDEIRELDDAGRWDDAVARATSTEAGSPNATFDAFAQLAEQSVADAGDAASADLEGAASGAQRVAWVALVAGVLAALAALWGFSARLKEYR
ncbi:hypothetical protein KIN34_11805 [Cellulomonas sp. DKR-3]|uniref:Secreted protein n=1 Tax=Cellulomonas fulva TaxID=2835530 RepID=A0ABS5U0N2_9CELL|nr:hypothetical protein [Cellulomonas fulva]MBT0994968.1 hypothetical protein [Cellulomonas fulva]